MEKANDGLDVLCLLGNKNGQNISHVLAFVCWAKNNKA